MMKTAPAPSHEDHAAVTAPQTAAHDSLDRDLARSSEAARRLCRRRQHALWTARVGHHRDPRRSLGEGALEWRHNPPTLTRRAVFGRDDERDTEGSEEVEVKELRRAPRSIKERRRYAACTERTSELREGRQTHPAGDHPGF